MEDSVEPLTCSIFTLKIKDMSATIRSAIASDSKAIITLIKELALFEKEPESVVLTETNIKEYGFGKKPLFECLVAEVDNQVIGIALFYSRFSTWKGPTFHLEDLIVTENYKGRGYGTQLYLAFINYSYNKGVQRIEWNVLDWNTPAVKFYEKSGANVLQEWCTVQMDTDAMKSYLAKH